jgi:hypothetical protein
MTQKFGISLGNSDLKPLGELPTPALTEFLSEAIIDRIDLGIVATLS